MNSNTITDFSFATSPEFANKEEVDAWIKAGRAIGVSEADLLSVLMSRLKYKNSVAIPAGSAGAKNKQGMTAGSVAITARNEDGSLAMALPAGMPPDVRGGYETNFRQIKAKDDLRRRLLAKLAKKKGEEVKA
jgi:hypothetical protein